MALRTRDPAVAVRSTEVFTETGAVGIEKETERVPAGTVTRGGTGAQAGSALASRTSSPPAGAGPERVTVPVTVRPPTTGFGSSVSASSAAVETSSSPVRVTPATVARMTTAVPAAGREVVTGKEAVSIPSGTVT